MEKYKLNIKINKNNNLDYVVFVPGRPDPQEGPGRGAAAGVRRHVRQHRGHQAPRPGGRDNQDRFWIQPTPRLFFS